MQRRIYEVNTLRQLLSGLLIRRIVPTLLTVLLVPSLASAQDLPPLDAYGDLPAVEDVALSPSGENIALIGTIDGHRLVMFLNRDLELMHLNRIGELKTRNIRWVGEEAVLLTYSETMALGTDFAADRQEITNVMVVPARSGGESFIIFNYNSSIADGVFGQHGIREIDGEWFGFFGGIELEFRSGADPGRFLQNGHPALFSVDLSDGRARRVERAPSRIYTRDWLVGDAGEARVELNIRDRDGSWEIVNASGRNLAEGQNRDGAVSLISMAPDGEGFIYSAEDADSGREVWYRSPIDASSPPQEFLQDEGIESILVDPDNGRMLGYVRPTFSAVPTMFDEQANELMQNVSNAFPGRRMQLTAWSRGFSTLVVRTAGNGDSGTYFLIDTETGEAGPIAVERPEIAASQVGEVSTYSYQAGDGLQINAVLTLPPVRPDDPMPAIILPHGGPASHDVVSFNWLAQAFASRGYLVLQPNFRGSTNRTQAFRMAGNGQWGRAMQSDLSDGLAALVEDGMVDPDRVCIMGMSYGGYAALAGVTLQQGLYRCAVAVAPVSDLDLLYLRERRETASNNLIQRSLIETLGPTSGFDAVSPRRYAAQADAPILLIHARNDTVVNFEHSAIMADALDDADRPYQLVELAQEDHWLSRADTRQQMLRAAMGFVLEHNPPD